jgi:hypothetical protein
MYKQPNYSKDPEIVRNRKDKSLLVVHTLRPERLLEPSVSFPDEVKHLDLDGDRNSSRISHEDWNLHWDWEWDEEFYTKTLFKDLVLFHNLEILTACGIRLDMDLWKEWARGCTQLREIDFSNADFKNTQYDYFGFDEQTLETIFKIPTLRKVKIESLELPFFPPGPSNIEELTITARAYDHYFEKDDDGKDEFDIDEMIESYSKNLCTHTNIKKLRIEHFVKFFMSPKPLLNMTKYCVNLEELYLEFIEITTKEDNEDVNVVRANVFEKIFQLPNLKKCTLVCSESRSIDDKPIAIERLVNDATLIFPSITHLRLLRNGEFCADFTGCDWILKDDEIRVVLKQFPNLQSCLRDDVELL